MEHMFSCDQVIVQTINSEQKGAGGIIGIIMLTGAVPRWVLSSHTITVTLSGIRSSIKLNQFKRKSKDVEKTQITMEEDAVGRCYNIIKLWVNPFQKNENIVGSSSQVVAPLNALGDLLRAEKIGKSCFKEFLKNRIETNNVEFYAPIRKLKLHTFDKRSAQTNIKLKKNGVAIKSDRETFPRLLVIQKNRNISLKEVIQFELSPTPLSLSNPDSSTTLRKAAKTELFKHLKSISSFVELIEQIIENIHQTFTTA